MELLTCSPVGYAVIWRWPAATAVRFFPTCICIRRSIASPCVSNPLSSLCLPRPLRKRIMYGCGHRVGLAQPQSAKDEPIPRAS
ncbi:hypothetical protein RKD44_000966 [Streptomyces collinus]